MDVNDPTTWEATPEGAEALGQMLGDEFAQMCMRFEEQRVSPVVHWLANNGLDKRSTIVAPMLLVKGLRAWADSLEKQVQSW